MMKSWKILVSSLLIASLTACGGGGGGGDSAVSGGGNSGSGDTGTENPGNDGGDNGTGGDTGDENTTPEPSYNTGVFIDSPVKGLRYTTPTLSGLTDMDGRFRYNDGERVTFSLGGIKIGETFGAAEITPFSLFDVKPPSKERIIKTALFDQASVQTLDKALNIAALLQNLDADQNPDNGIDLADADAVLANSSLDFGKHKATTFNANANIASLRKAAGLSEQPIELEQIAAHLYSSLGVEIQSSSVANTAGKSGLKESFATNYQYDDEGRVISEEIDTNGDGVIDITKTFRYENDLLVETSNSKLKTTETLSYDASKRLINRVTRYDNGTASQERYTYSGELVTQFSFDKDNDGQADRVSDFTYDSDGRLIQTDVDIDGDGSIDIRTTASYYSDGKQATHSEDKNNDGIPNLVIAYTYDAEGNRKAFNINVDENAIPAQTSLFTYAGKLVKEYFVLDAEYRLTFKETYSYDSQGRRKSVLKDSNGDGKMDVRVQYKYDEAGNRILAAEDHNNDGVADKVWRQSVNNATLISPWGRILKQG